MSDFLVCRIGEIKIGIKSDNILEIVEKREITELPMKSNVVKGIFNLRGNILPFFDISKMLSGKSNTSEFEYFVIVESKHGKTAGMGINEIIGNISEEEVNERMVPGKVEKEIEKSFLKGIIKKEKELIFILDIDNLIEKQEVI